MTSSPSIAVLEFHLQPSRWLRLYICVFHSVLALLALALPLQLWSSLAMSVAVAVSGLYWFNWLNAGPLVTQLQWRTGGWHLNVRGANCAADLRHYWLRPWGLMLHFNLDDGRNCKVLILRDQLSARKYRHLRVMVLQGGTESAADGS